MYRSNGRHCRDCVTRYYEILNNMPNPLIV